MPGTYTGMETIVRNKPPKKRRKKGAYGIADIPRAIERRSQLKDQHSKIPVIVQKHDTLPVPNEIAIDHSIPDISYPSPSAIFTDNIQSVCSDDTSTTTVAPIQWLLFH